MTLTEVAKRLGHPVKCVRGKFIREGLLPWPDENVTWAREDVENLWRWLDARSRGQPAVRPVHRTGRD